MKFNAVQLCIIYGSMHLISQEITHCLLLDFTRLIFDKLHPSGLANNELYFKKKKLGAKLHAGIVLVAKEKII